MTGKRSIIALVLLSVLAGMLTPGSSSALSDSDELMEWDKDYRKEEETEETESPIHVVVSEEAAASERKDGEDADKVELETRYSWEKPLKNENVEKLFLKNSRKIGDELNDSSERTVTIPEGENQLIDQFTRTYLDSYLSREMPDLGVYYDLSNEVRKENRLLIEAYIYEHAVSGAHTVDSYDREFFITKVTPLSRGVDEVIFYLVDVLHTDNGDEDSGTWFVADIGLTEEGYKFLNLWRDGGEFEMMQTWLKGDFLNRKIPLERESLKIYLQNRVMEAEKSYRSTQPYVDPDR